MKSWPVLFLLMLVSCKAPAGTPVAGGASSLPVHPEVLNLQASFTNVAETVKPAVVSISTVHIEQIPEAPMFFFGDPFDFFSEEYGNPYQRRDAPRQRMRQFRQEGVGSGVVIDAEGLVLTNEHVVRGADEIKVLFYDKNGKKSEYPGKVIGKDARTDLAVVRIKGTTTFPFAKLADSEQVKVGDWAIAIGSPFGLAQTVTAGIISAARQSLAIDDREYRNMIQTDAAINRGNSGGPLLNIRGEVIGINTAIYAPSGAFAGIGFAIPSNQAKLILDDLVIKGRVVRGWLGVELGREITPAMVKAFGLPDDKGALVNSVMKNSPAENAGLKRGDVVRRYEGKEIDDAAALQALVSQTPPKKTVSLDVIRERKILTLSLTLAERPDQLDVREAASPRSSNEARDDSEVSWEGARFEAGEEGVTVTTVDPNSASAALGLLPGDVIRAVNQRPTPEPKTFAKVVKSAKLSDGIVFDVLRQGRSLYLSYTRP